MPKPMLVYVHLISRARFERRTEWVVRVMGKFLPRRLGESSLAIFALWMLGNLAVELVVFGAALFGILRMTDPLTALGLAFAFLLVAAAGVGATTVRRTVIPQDEERLLLAPVSDRRAHLLSFAGSGLFELLQSVVAFPIVVGVAASVVLRDEVSPVALWATVSLTVLAGTPLAYAVDRLLGLLRVRRVSRGVRGASVAWYAIVSVATFGVGWLLARICAPWLADFPRDIQRSNQWALSFPDYAADGLSFVGPILVHEGSPPGALARAALGDTGSLFVGALWVGAAMAVAVLLWAGSGRWYRSEWRSGWQSWEREDLFDLAERFYLRLAGVFHRGNVPLEVQIHNLCRRREWSAANVFDLAGGAFNWLPVGLALGAAPSLRESLTAAAVFALLVGGFQGAENAGGPFAFFREALVLDAEGRQAGLYRAAGTSVLELYRAKLNLGRLISAPPLTASLALIAVLGGFHPGAWVLLFAAGAAAWVVGLHVQLLPGLVSPHFDWEHPDEIEDYYERDRLSDWTSRLASGLYIVELALVATLLSGRLSYGTFAFVAPGIMVTIAVGASLVMVRLSRRVARFADRADFPA